MSTHRSESYRRSHVEHAQQEQTRRDQWELSDDVEDVIDECSRALTYGSREHYLYVGRRLRDDLLPMLLHARGKNIGYYDDKIAGHENWYFDSLWEFHLGGTDHLDVLATHASAGSRNITLQTQGMAPEEQAARRTIERAFKSCAAIAEFENDIAEELASRVDAVGLNLKLGEHLQDEHMDIGDPVQITSLQATTVKSLFCGPTGLGKSTGTEGGAEDYYQANFQEGRDYKVLDILGFRQGENWLLDIPQQQKDLRRVREEQGLPVDFTDTDDLEQPNLEVYVPLTKGLASEEFPFTEDGDSVVQPFVIPACELRKPLLVSLVMSRLSEGEEQTIREAYDDVNDAKTDWSLADLADEIRDRDELSDKHKSKAIGVLRGLQNEGFIRTRDCEHDDCVDDVCDYVIDWEDLFRDTETYTVFSQARCPNELSKLITFAYLADTIIETRQNLPFVDQCVIVMREFWEVVPHKRRRAFDARAAAVQEAIGQIVMKVMRQDRHGGLHILADTQQPNDLLKSVREEFNRYVVYSANYDTIKDIFSWTSNDKDRSFWATMTPRAGEAGIVGQVEPAIQNRHIEFVSPVKMAPPSHHHFDVEVDGTGWHARCKYTQAIDWMPDEELQEPVEVPGVVWPDEVPDRLSIDPFKEHVEDERPDPEVFPIQAFAHDCVARSPGKNTRKAEIYEAFNAYAEYHGHDPWDFDDHGVSIKFGGKLKENVDGDLKNTSVGQGEQAYQDLRLTGTAQNYLSGDVGDPAPTAPADD